MKMKEEHEVEKENGERWVLTYADMITLLMVFFIVMYSMSELDSKKYAEISEQLSISLGEGKTSIINIGAEKGSAGEGENPEATDASQPYQIENKGNVLNTGDKSNDGTGGTSDEIKYSEGLILEDIENKIKNFIQQENLSAQVSVYKDSRGEVISFTEALLFDKGSADIHEYRLFIVNKVSEIIAQIDNEIQIEGFTDDLYIHTSKFDSNWELAAQRSINVGKSIINYGIDPTRVSCVSYGEFRPKESNESEQGRAKNRRVDIILLSKPL